MKRILNQPEVRSQIEDSPWRRSEVSFLATPSLEFAASSRRSLAKTEGRIRRGGLRVHHRMDSPWRASESGFVNPRLLCAFALCSAGALLAMLSFAAPPPLHRTPRTPPSPTITGN